MVSSLLAPSLHQYLPYQRTGRSIQFQEIKPGRKTAGIGRAEMHTIYNMGHQFSSGHVKQFNRSNFNRWIGKDKIDLLRCRHRVNQQLFFQKMILNSYGLTNHREDGVIHIERPLGFGIGHPVAEALPFSISPW